MALSELFKSSPDASLRQAIAMSKDLKHKTIVRGERRVELAPDQMAERNRYIAETLSHILELPISRPLYLDRQAVEPGVLNPAIERRM